MQEGRPPLSAPPHADRKKTSLSPFLVVSTANAEVSNVCEAKHILLLVQTDVHHARWRIFSKCAPFDSKIKPFFNAV